MLSRRKARPKRKDRLLWIWERKMILASGRFFLMIGMSAVTFPASGVNPYLAGEKPTLRVIDHDHARVESPLFPERLVYLVSALY